MSFNRAKQIYMKHLTILIAAMLVSLTMAAQQATYDDDFTQTRLIKAAGKTVSKAGHMVFDGKESLAMTYTEPAGEYFIVEGKKVKMNLNGKKGEVDANKVKSVGLQRTTLLNCLAGNWEEAAKANNAKSEVSDGKGTRTITLKANGRVPRGGYASVELIYRTKDGKLTKMVLEEAAGIVNTYELAR